jgi:hypothetical protein
VNRWWWRRFIVSEDFFKIVLFLFPLKLQVSFLYCWYVKLSTPVFIFLFFIFVLSFL